MKINHQHHQSIVILGVSVVLLLFLFWSSWCLAQELEKPIKIGFLTSFSGPLAGPGRSMKNGFLLYLEQIGNQLAGRSVEIFYEDSAGDPDTTRARAKKLVEKDKVNIVIGPVNSAEGMAIRDYLSEQGIPTLLEATIDEIVERKFIFRTTFSTRPASFLVGSVAGKAGYRKAVAFGLDYVAAQVGSAFFEKGFVAEGGIVIKKILVPFGTMDFRPFFAQIPKDADVGLVVIPGGAMSIAFIKQYAESGLKGKLPLYGHAATCDEEILHEQGEAAEGFVGVSFYYSTIDSPKNKSFVQEYVNKYGMRPNWFAAGSYTAAMAIDTAAKKTEGRVEDKESFIQALRAIRLVTPAGPFRFENHEAVQPRYVGQIRKVEGKMAPVIIQTIPEFLPVVP